MKIKSVLLLLLFIFSFTSIIAQKYTLSGYVSDKKSGEKLKGVSIFITAKNSGTISNEFGFYSLTLPADSLEIIVSYSGYTSFQKQIDLSATQSLNIELESFSTTLQAVTVKSVKKNVVSSTQMSTVDLSIETIKSLPKFLGETDILKAIQLLPGVQAGGEGQSGIYVRGGGPDENLVLLDGVPVYNASHLFGFFSVFNADAVKNVELIKGGFPARYGGRLSSILDINMKEGNSNGLHGEGGIGIIASRFTLEGPFRKNKKSSFMISGRRTYIDILAKAFSKDKTKSNGYYFYDLNAKLNFKLSEKDHLYMSGYFGNDKFYNKEKSDNQNTSAGINWGNITGVIRWNHLYSPKIFGNLSAHISKYKFTLKSEENSKTNADEFYKIQYYSGIKDYNIRYDLDIIPAPDQIIKIGTGVTFHSYKPGVQQTKQSNTGSTPVDETLYSRYINSRESDSYIEDDIRLTDHLKTNVGIHFSTFSVDKKTYTSLQPRIALRYLLNKDLSIKASYSQMAQYIHLLTNNNIGLPTDLWVPTTKNVLPQYSKQIALGLAYNLQGNYEFTVEGYYKKMENVIEYLEGASYMNSTSNWEDKVTSGNGWCYGSEFFLQRKKGRLTGLIGYTLSWSNRRFADLNNGNKFSYKYDRRNDLKTAIVFKVNARTELSANWVFGTGQAITIPVEKFMDANGDVITVYNDRNSYRMPAYHRLDVAATFTKVKKHYTRSWVVSIYNLYNRANPFYIYLDNNTNSSSNDALTFKQLSLFPILPSVSWQFKF